GDFVPGSVGSSVTLSPGESRTNLVLLNSSSFSPEAGWKVEFNRINNYAPRGEQTSTAAGIHLDLSNVDASLSYDTNFNLRDYGNVTVSLDVKALRGPIEVSLSLDIYSFLSVTPFASYHDGKSVPLNTSQTTRITLEVDTKELYAAWSPLWLAQSYVRIDVYPYSSHWTELGDVQLDASLLLENMTISAVSSASLSPLSVDTQDTQGSSVYETGLILNWIEWPAVNLTNEEFPSEWGMFVPWKSNDTVYVQAGNYSGTAGFYNFNYSNYTFDTSFEILSNTILTLGLRFEMVRVNLSISPALPYLRISMWYPDYPRSDYYVEVIPPFPDALYIPKRSGTLYISFHTPPRVESREIVYRISMNVTEPVSLYVHLHIPMFPVFGIMLSTGELLLVILALALLTGAVASTHKPNTQRRWTDRFKDPHFWPAFLVGVSAFVPWFVTSWDIGESVFVQRSLYLPFAMGLDSTTNSLAALVVSPSMLLDIPFRIAFFWVPLRWAFGHVGSPKRWNFDFFYVICISFPLLNGIMFYLYTPMPLTISLGFLLVVAAPILWGFEILIYRGLKRSRK
ncbi:MAG: hypothetical protein ACFFDD_11275, partial [Promethearchaeota archaeon]